MGLKCLICDSSSRYMYKWIHPYSLYYCPKCKSLFSNPIPSENELNKYYQGFLYKKTSSDNLRKPILKKKKELKELFGNQIEHGLSFLDYGGGTGMASLAAAELGLKVTLCEIDSEAVDFVRSLKTDYSINICSNLSELEEQSFDFIFADNVIEHVRQPQVLMSTLYAHLNQHGQLIVKTPNARNTELLFHPMVSVRGYIKRVYQFNNFSTAIFAAFFRPWTLDPPRHLYSFSAISLNLLAEQSGVDNSAIGYYRIPLWEYSIAKELLCIPNSAIGTVKWLVMLLLLPLEIISKIIEVILKKINVISTGGLFIKIRRN